MDSCWVQAHTAGNSFWIRGKGNGGNYPNESFEGEYNIFLKMASVENLGDITCLELPPIQMEGFNNAKLIFTHYNQTRSGMTDELSILYRTSNSDTWNLWEVYNTNQDSWRLDTLVLPENINTSELQICFQGRIIGGYGICLDYISLEGFLAENVQNHQIDNEICVYPNPTAGELRIESEKLTIMGAEIYDVVGKRVWAKFPSNKLDEWQSQIGGMAINLSYLQPGFYFVRVTTEKGVVVRKFVKSEN